MLDIAVTILLILCGFGFIRYSAREDLDRRDRLNLRFLWLYHLLFSVLFYIFISNNSADANGYWRIAKNASWDDFYFFLTQGPGTYFIYVFNFIPSHVLDLHIFTGTVFYSLLSFIGFVFFYKMAKTLISFNTNVFGIPLFPYIFFLPSFHFWTVGVGKDSLLLFCIGTFGYAILNLRKRYLLLLLSLALTYMVRPHILILLLVSFGFGYLFSSKVKGYKRVLSFAILIGLSIIVLPRVFAYANIDGYNLDSVFSRFDRQAQNLSGQDVGSSIDITSYSYPMKFFTFLFRPLFFDAKNALYLLASVENLIFLLLTLKLIVSKPIQAIRKAPLLFKGYLLFLLFGTLLFSSILGNLGIILRMKIMVFPGFILYMLWAFSFKTETETTNLEQLSKNTEGYG
ncbi:MAG: hypothetical protein KTR22_06450 [Flavobacteriaceae bacterium]|nr:hypothetical protein [Flavobacteriaceae bacterium]